jgi:uncharacterized membrane protein YgcG
MPILKHRSPLIVPVVSALLLLPGFLSAKDYIHDGANLFDADTKGRLEVGIKEIVRRFNVDVVIETCHELPPEVAKGSKDIAGSITSWADAKADEVNAQGVYILIVETPQAVRVRVGPGAKEMGYSQGDGNRLASRFRNDFLRKQYGKTIERGVGSIRDSLQTSELLARWLWIVGIIGIVILLWISLMVINGCIHSPDLRKDVPEEPDAGADHGPAREGFELPSAEGAMLEIEGAVAAVRTPDV